MTYEQFGDIAAKMHVFYSQAFDTLISKHDATKVGYKRELRCRLDSDTFRAVLSAFCAQTYLSSELAFDRQRAITLLETAKQLLPTPAVFDTAEFIDDATISLSFLVYDGLQLTFAHRSFQEYFAAGFMLGCGDRQRQKLMQQLLGRLLSADVGRLLFDMNQAVFEDEFILPMLREVRRLSDYSEKRSSEEAFATFMLNTSISILASERSWEITYDDPNLDFEDFHAFIMEVYPPAVSEIATATQGHLYAALAAVRGVPPDATLDSSGGSIVPAYSVTRADLLDRNVAIALAQDMPDDYAAFQHGLGLYDIIVKRLRRREAALDALLDQ